jgi:N-acetylated-alpha-linked acidic dipeptidase
MARVLGLETIRMADADVLPYDYVTYARQITAYLAEAKRKAADTGVTGLDFAPAEEAATRMAAAARKVEALEKTPQADPSKLNAALRQTETAFISPQGLPRRPWFRHTIYAPGEYTGYEAVVIPGVNEAIDAKNAPLATAQLTLLTEALDRAARALDTAE